MELRPVVWTNLQDRVRVIGHDERDQSIELDIPIGHTYLLRFRVPAPTNLRDQLGLLSKTFVGISPFDQRVAVIINGPSQLNLRLPRPDIQVIRDPVDKLGSLWRLRELSPYRPFRVVGETQPIEPRRLEPGPSDLELELLDQASPTIEPRLLFWDIEVLSTGEFPDARNPEHPVFMISASTLNQDYLLTWLPIEPFGRVQLIRATNEANLIERFFELVVTLGAEWLVSYNGDAFDSTYLGRRIRLLQSQGHEVRLPVGFYFMDDYIFGPYGYQAALNLNGPGLVNIDLLRFIRRYQPGQPNYRLETIAQDFLGRGKVDLEPEAMMAAVRSGHPEQLAQVAAYSVEDSRLLRDLWQRLDLTNRMTELANLFQVTVTDLYRYSWNRLVENFIFKLAPGGLAIPRQLPWVTPFIQPLRPGRYRQVYVYDYRRLYLELLRSTEDGLIRLLADELLATPIDRLPGDFIFQLYTSYRPQDLDYHPIDQQLQSIIGSIGSKIKVESTQIWTQHPIEHRLFDLVTSYDHVVVITPDSYFTIRGDLITPFGYSSIMRPPFPLAQEVVQATLRAMAAGRYYQPPNLQILQPSLEQLVQTNRVRDPRFYVRPHINRSLAQQYLTTSPSHSIETRAQVPWIQTLKGPKILALFNPATDRIDLAYYQQRLNTFVQELQQLPVSN